VSGQKSEYREQKAENRRKNERKYKDVGTGKVEADWY
jgi:hypothetical protein